MNGSCCKMVGAFPQPAATSDSDLVKEYEAVDPKLRSVVFVVPASTPC